MKADLLILDGRHLLHRAGDVFRTLEIEADGEMIPTGSMYGFLYVSTKIHQRYGGRTVVAWEGYDNFRRELYPEYKRRKYNIDEQEIADRRRDMDAQELRLMAMLRAMGVSQYLSKGGEADDVIGRLSRSKSVKKGLTVIYSGDSDLRQLVNDRVVCVSPGMRGKKDVVWDRAAVELKYNVPPELIADIKALGGDSSDNIPGVRGIGERTAMHAVHRLGEVSNIIEAARNGDNIHIPERFRKLIVDQAENLLLYKRLTTINMKIDWMGIDTDKSQRRLVHHFKAYRFRSLLAPLELRTLMKMGDRR